MSISEITEEKDEEAPCFADTAAQKERIRRIIERQRSVYSVSSSSSAVASCCFANTAAQKERIRIRRMIEYQRFVYSALSSSSSSSCSAVASCSSFSSSRKSSSLLQLMKGGSTSLTRLFDMEHTSLEMYFDNYSGSPIIKPILLRGSDTDDESHDLPSRSAEIRPSI